MARRSLSLKRETLADLAPEELSAVVGAGAGCDATCPYVYCVVLSRVLTCSGSCGPDR